MSVPRVIRTTVREKLWAEADRLNWSALSAADKSRYYTMWTETEGLGGQLGIYMDPRQVRVYIKDTLLKSYTREALSNHDQVFRVLSIPKDTVIEESYIKPHGRLLSDGRQVAWSRASEWKATLMALFERSFTHGRAHAAVLMEAKARYATVEERALVESAALKLGVQRIVWID